MNLEKLTQQLELQDFPVGLGGCKITENTFDSCGLDLVVFDGKDDSPQVIDFENNLVVLHHAKFSEKNPMKLLQYENIKIIQDDSWELKLFISKIHEKHSSLIYDYAKTSLMESLFACKKSKISLENGSLFASCWLKTGSFFLSDAISSLNGKKVGATHMLNFLRKLEKNPINEKILTITETVGIERSSTILLERMLKSTIGFSDLVEKNNFSLLIRQTYDNFIKNSMLSDCYFYLGYLNKQNFFKIKDSIEKNVDLFHILKIGFDIDSDDTLIENQITLLEESCSQILEIMSNKSQFSPNLLK